MISTEETRYLLIQRIHLGDRAGANTLLDAWALKHGYESLLKEVLDPILAGEDWSSSETFTLAQVATIQHCRLP